MSKRFMMSVAAIALIAGTGFASAQGMNREGGAAGGAMKQSAPVQDRAAPAERAAPVNKDEATDTNPRNDSGSGMKAQSDDKMQRDNGGKSAQDDAPDKNANGKNADSKNADSKNADGKSQTTTGQAAAGGKMSSEQRTKVTTVIKQQNIKPVTNINFSVSIGTRVPRDVGFHPLPAEIVTVYPDWRGYEFFLVSDQIVVVNPRTLEIVAVIDA